MIRLLIVDDSALVRQVLTKGLGEYDDIEVVGAAPDPYVAREMLVKLKPDVMTLDIEMPRMDGITFLKKIMHYFPLPVIIISSVTTRDNQAALQALEIGAFEVVNKPGGSISIGDVLEDVVRKIRGAYKVRKSFLSRRAVVGLAVKRERTSSVESLSRMKTTKGLIAIGSSTGGTVALEYILSQLPPNLPPVLIVQHMPENYTAPFADRLNGLSALHIKESESGEIIQSGYVYIARAGDHMLYQIRGTQQRIMHDRGDKVSFQRPAVDVLFKSLAARAGGNVLAIILTGMGSDGAAGLLKLKEAGAKTIAQDRESSIVWGMPQAAVKLGAAKKILPLDQIPQEIINFSLSRREL